MELDVIYLNATVLLRRISILDEELVIDAKLALRHPTQLSLDEDLSNDISLQDGAPNGEEDIHVLHSVYKDFVPLIANPLGPPGYGARRLDRYLLQFLYVLTWRKLIIRKLTFRFGLACLP
jgi:hypothetical protein